MFEHLNMPQEAYNYKLGATLKMEETAVEVLEESIENAQDLKVRSLLNDHLEETRGHVETVKEVFGLFDWEVDDSACPAIDGLQKEAKATVKKTDDAIVDSVILQGALEVEHHEIGVYENLILNAEAMGRQDVVTALKRNLDSEQATLSKVRSLQAEVAAVTPKQTA